MKYEKPTSLIEMFNCGMARSFPDIEPIIGHGLNLGAGNKTIVDSLPIGLGVNGWNAEKSPIPYRGESFDFIIAFHFLEHITSARVPYVLLECQRVLRVGGTLNILVPHADGGMAFQDLDYKSFYNSHTWKILMKNKFYVRYTDDKWRLDLRLNIIMGEDERCLALLSQFVKT